MPIQLRFDFVGAVELSPTARLVGQILDRTRREHSECWLASKTIAHKIGRSVRTVQLALQELVRADLVRIARNYALKSRRRIVLLWRGGGPEPSPFGEVDCAEPAQPIAPSIDPPPHPPIERPLKREERELNNDDHDSDSSPAEASPESSSSQTPSAPPTKATKAQVERVVAKAKQLFPRDLFIGARVKTEARRCGAFGGGLSWVEQALDLAEAAQARSWGYVAATCRNWRDEGGPPPPPPTAEEQAAAQAEFDRRLLEELRLQGLL